MFLWKNTELTKDKVSAMPIPYEMSYRSFFDIAQGTVTSFGWCKNNKPLVEAQSKEWHISESNKKCVYILFIIFTLDGYGFI